MRPRDLHLLALVAYLVLALAAAHPLWMHLTSALPSDIGDPLLNTWIVAWDGHALLTDPAGLFDANIFYPLRNTLAFSEHLLGTAVPALPILLLSNEPVLAYNLSFLIGFALSGWSAYLLFRRHTRHGWAAFVGGLAFAFAPYRFAAYSHLQLLTFQWLPLSLLLLDSLLARPSAGVGLALVVLLALQMATSWHLAVFSLAVTAIYLLGRLAAGQWQRRGAGAAVLAMALAAALIVPIAAPYLGVVRDLQVSRPMSVAADFAAHPADYAAAPPISRLYGGLTAALSRRPLFTEENFLFPGLVAPALAALGLVWAVRPRRRRIPAVTWALLLVLALALTFGPIVVAGRREITLPYAWLAALSPVFGLIRVPPRWMMAGLLPLAALAAMGVVALGPAGRRAPLALLLGSALLLESWSAPLPLAQVGSLEELPPVYRWLSAQPGEFGVLEWPIHVAPHPEYPETRRLYASTQHWKRLVNGYSGFTPARQIELDAELAGFPDGRSLNALRGLAGAGVRYLIVHSLEAGVDRAVWEGRDRWTLERSPSTRPVWDGAGDFVYELTAGPDALPPDAVPQDVSWPGGVRLAGWTADVEAGSIDLYWLASARPALDRVTVFLHLVDAAGKVIAQGDGAPVSGHYPFRDWRPGELLCDRRRLVPAPGASLADGVTLRVGLYYVDSMERLPIANADPESPADYAALSLPERGSR